MQITRDLEKYFWDADIRKIDVEENAEYIASRILEYGDLGAIKWLFKNIGKKTIKKVLLNRKDLSLKSRLFWGRFFGINSETRKKWLKRSYQKLQNPAWRY